MQDLFKSLDELIETAIQNDEATLYEISDAINNLKAGQYEEVYNILVGLSDELTTRIITLKADLKDNKKEQGEA